MAERSFADEDKRLRLKQGEVCSGHVGLSIVHSASLIGAL